MNDSPYVSLEDNVQRKVNIRTWDNLMEDTFMKNVLKNAQVSTKSSKQFQSSPKSEILLQSLLNLVREDGSFELPVDINNIIQNTTKSLFDSSSLEISNFIPVFQYIDELIQSYIKSNEAQLLTNNNSLLYTNLMNSNEIANQKSLGGIMFDAIMPIIQKTEFLSTDMIIQILDYTIHTLNEIPQAKKLNASMSNIKNIQNFLFFIAKSPEFNQPKVINNLILLFSTLARVLHASHFYLFLLLSLQLQERELIEDCSISLEFPFEKEQTTILYAWEHNDYIELYDDNVNIYGRTKDAIFNLEARKKIDIHQDILNSEVITFNGSAFIGLSLNKNEEDIIIDVHYLNIDDDTNLSHSKLTLPELDASIPQYQIFLAWSQKSEVFILIKLEEEGKYILAYLLISKDENSIKRSTIIKLDDEPYYAFCPKPNTFCFMNKGKLFSRTYLYDYNNGTLFSPYDSYIAFPNDESLICSANANRIIIYSKETRKIEMIDLKYNSFSSPLVYELNQHIKSKDISVNNTPSQTKRIIQFLENLLTVVIQRIQLNNFDGMEEVYKFFTADPFDVLEILLPLSIELFNQGHISIELMKIILMSMLVFIHALCKIHANGKLPDSSVILEQLLTFIKMMLETPQFYEDSIILSLIVMITCQSFPWLCPQKIKDATNIIKIIIKNPKTYEMFKQNKLIINLFQTPLILYILNDRVIDMLKEAAPFSLFYHLVFGTFNIFSTYLNQDNNMKHFQTYVVEMTQFLSKHICEGENVIMYMNQLISLAYRIISFKGAVYLHKKFADTFSQRINEFFSILMKNAEIENSEQLYGCPKTHTCESQIWSTVFESPHNASHRFEDSLKINQPNGDEIVFNFDPQCALDSTKSEFVITYSKPDGSNARIKLPGSSSSPKFPLTLRLPTNNCQILMKSSAFEQYYGVKVTIKVQYYQDNSVFEPSVGHVLANYICYLYSRCLMSSIKSLPLTENEITYDEYIKLNLIQDISDNSIVYSTSTIVPQTPPPPRKTLFRSDTSKSPQESDSEASPQPSTSHDQKKLLSSKGSSTRQFPSRQLSTATPVTQQQSSTRSFSRGMSFDLSRGPAQHLKNALQGFLQDMINEKPRENFPAEIFLKHMYSSVKFTYKYSQCAEINELEKLFAAVLLKHLNLAQDAVSFAMALKQNENRTDTPEMLKKIWSYVYKLRLSMIYRRQKYEDSKLQTFQNNMRDKSLYLLNYDTLLPSGDNNHEHFVHVLMSFLQSDITIQDIKSIHQTQKMRFNIRTMSLKQFFVIINQAENLPISSKIIIISQFTDVFNSILSGNESKVVFPNEIVQQNMTAEMLVSDMITKIADESVHPLLQYVYHKILAVPFHKFMSPDSQSKALNLLVKRVASSIIQHDFEGQEICWNSTWMMIASIVLNSNINSSQYFLDLMISSENEDNLHFSCYLLSILILLNKYDLKSFSSLLHLIPNASPKTVISIYSLICQQLVTHGYGSGLPESFLLSIIDTIGSIYTISSCPLINADFFAESQLYVAQELVSLLRMMLRPFSKVHSQLIHVFRTLFNNFIQNPAQPEFKARVKAALFVLGNGLNSVTATKIGLISDSRNFLQPFFVDEYNTFLTDSLNGYSFLTGLPINTSDNIIPVPRVSSRPDLFDLTDDQMNFFMKIPSTDDIAPFFYTFLPTYLQSDKHANQFLSTYGFDNIISFSLQNTLPSKFQSITQLEEKWIKSLIRKSTNPQIHNILTSDQLFYYELTLDQIYSSFEYGFDFYRETINDTVKFLLQPTQSLCIASFQTSSIPTEFTTYSEKQDQYTFGCGFYNNIILFITDKFSFTVYPVNLKYFMPYYSISPGTEIGFSSLKDNCDKLKLIASIDDFVNKIKTTPTLNRLETKEKSENISLVDITHKSSRHASHVIFRSLVNTIEEEEDKEEEGREEEEEDEEDSSSTDVVEGTNGNNETDEPNQVYTQSDEDDESMDSYGYSDDATPIVPTDIPLDQIEKPILFRLFVGQLVKVDKSLLPIMTSRRKDIMILELMKYDHKIGIISSIKPYDSTSISTDVTVCFKNRDTGLVNQVEIDSRLLVPLKENVIETVYDEIIPDHGQLNHMISVRNARYSTLFLIDYLIRNKQFSYDNPHFYSLIINEVIPFKLTAKPLQEDLCFSYKNLDFEKSHMINEYTYLLPQNIHSMKNYFINLLQQLMKDKQFVYSMLKSVDRFPNFPYDDMIKYVPQDLIFHGTYFNKIKLTELAINIPNAIGFIPIISEQTSSDVSISITGEETKLEFKKFEQALTLYGFICENKLKIKFVGSTNESNDISFGLLPLMENHSDFEIGSPAGFLHKLFTIIRLSIAYCSEKEMIINILSSGLIENIIHVLPINLLTHSAYYTLLVDIFSSLTFSQKDISTDLIDYFNNYCQQFTVNFETNPIPIHIQQIIVLKIIFRRISLNFSYSDISSDIPEISSIYITPENINTAISRRSITRVYDTFQTVSSCKEENEKFADVLKSFELCSAVTCQNQFPLHLLVDIWIDQQAPVLQINGSSLEIPVDLKYADEVSVVFDSKLSKIPQGTVIEATGENMCTKLNHYTKTHVPTNKFIIKVYLPAETNESEFFLNGYVKTHSISDIQKKNFFVKNRKQFFTYIQAFEQIWNNELDECLARLKFDSGPNNNPSYNSSQLALYPQLSKFDTDIITIRYRLVNKFNDIVPRLFGYTDPSQGSQPLSKLILSAASSVSYSHKEQRLSTSIMRQNYLPKLELNFNRSKAVLALSDPENPLGLTLLEQFIQQVPPDCLQNLRQGDTPWRVHLKGEGATDAGGPGRDLFSHICKEFLEPQLQLFIHVPSISSYVPHTGELTPKKRKMLLYVGALISTSYVSKLPQPFYFADFIWSYFVGRSIKAEDIYTLDHNFERQMKAIRAFDAPDAFDHKFDLKFVCQNALGDEVELIPGGSLKKVTFQSRMDYCKMCENYRIHEFEIPLEIIAEGVSMFFPSSLRQLLSPWELKLLVCGDLDVPIAELKKNCRIDGAQNYIDMLWNVLTRFTPQERMLFIKFATGRMGIPPPGMKWTNPLIVRFDVFFGRAEADNRLPTASTCSSTITIPLYSNEEIMYTRLKTAILFGCDIERDHDMELNDIVSLS